MQLFSRYKSREIEKHQQIYLEEKPRGLFPRLFYKKEEISLERFEELFKIRFLDHLCFKSADYLKHAIALTSKRLKKGSNQQAAHWAKAMFEEEFDLKHFPLLTIKQVNPLVGHGVYALQNIAHFTFLGEYTGMVRKRNRLKDKFNNYIFGYNACGSSVPYVVDAENHGNVTRFFNHSDEPNLHSKWIEINGISHIIFYAARLIHKGEQLTYDYGPYYWKKRAQPIHMTQQSPRD